MTRTLFLHAGPPKTGSTTIQTYFRDNAAAFRKQGLYWPKTGTEIRSHYHRALVNAFLPEGKQAALLQKLVRELRDQGLPERVFITAEMFAAKFDQPGYAANLSAFCRELGYRLHIIAYIRPQAVLLNSLYTQNVKNWRAAETIDHFLKLQIEAGRHDYARLFELILNDKDVDVTLRPFSREVLRRGLTADLCQVLGIDASGQILAEPTIANTSPGPRTLAAFLQLASRVRTELPGFNRERLGALTWPLIRAAGALGWNAEKFGGFTEAQQKLIAAAYEESNHQLAQRAWSKPWLSVFTPEECLPPALNIFDPATAEPRQRQEFHDFVERSMETITEFATDSEED